VVVDFAAVQSVASLLADHLDHNDNGFAVAQATTSLLMLNKNQKLVAYAVVELWLVHAVQNELAAVAVVVVDVVAVVVVEGMVTLLSMVEFAADAYFDSANDVVAAAADGVDFVCGGGLVVDGVVVVEYRVQIHWLVVCGGCGGREQVYPEIVDMQKDSSHPY
jgi:hypothetical protein